MSQRPVSQYVTAALALFAAGLTLAACNSDPEPRRAVEQTGHVEGSVTLQGADSNAGVVVSVAGAATETGKDGSFRIESVPVGERQLEAAKPGWKRHTEVVTVQAEKTKTVTITLTSEEADEENAAPVVAAFGVDAPQMAAGGTARVSATASDPDGDELSYTFSAEGGFSVAKDETETGSTATITAPDEPGTSGSISVLVEDGNGGQAEASLPVRTTDNSAPVVAALSASPPQLEPGATASVQASVTDADGDELSYTWSAPSNWSVEGSGDASGGTAKLTAPDSYDATGTLDLTVEDAHGATGTAKLAVSTVGSPGSPRISTVSAAPKQVAPGGSIQLTVSATDPAGGQLNYQWKGPADWTFGDATQAKTSLKAPQTAGAQASISVEISSEAGKTATATLLVSTRENRPPLLSALSANPSVVAPGGQVNVTASAQDPDGDKLNYTWSAPSEWNPSSSGAAMTLTAPDSYGERAKIEVTVSDGSASAKSAVTVSTATNRPPTIANVSGRPIPVSAGGTVELQASANDPNGDALTYTWSAANGDWSLQSTTGQTVKLDAPATEGSQTAVDLTVTDGAGGQATASLTVDTLDCPAGWSDCDKSAANGCETNLGSDPANCGGCGNTCTASQNAVPTCSSGSCGLRCTGGFGDCDGMASNGCETDLRSADDHCGRCGNACQGANNATGVCSNRTCQIQCKPGFKDCDGNPGNGCEAADSGIAQACASTTCNTIKKAGHASGDGTYWIDPDGGSTSNAYEAYCDMTTDGGGWTLLGTISGSDANNWNTKIGYWGNTKTLGSPSKPYKDFKSQAWVNLDVSSADILFQRRYDGTIRGQVVMKNCTRGRKNFYQLFTPWNDDNQKAACSRNDMTVLKSSSIGVDDSRDAEGKEWGLAGYRTNGICWNGGDYSGNRFRGHLVWTSDDANHCRQSGHAGGVGVWRNWDSQYSNADITGVNWVNSVNYSKVDVSLFAR